jgi:hypothetical protein
MLAETVVWADEWLGARAMAMARRKKTAGIRWVGMESPGVRCRTAMAEPGRVLLVELDANSGKLLWRMSLSGGAVLQGCARFPE